MRKVVAGLVAAFQKQFGIVAQQVAASCSPEALPAFAVEIPPRKYSNGDVKYSTVSVGSFGTKRMQVQFTDTYGVLK